jgi:hypothetical protein
MVHGARILKSPRARQAKVLSETAGFSASSRRSDLFVAGFLRVASAMVVIANVQALKNLLKNPFEPSNPRASSGQPPQ